MSVTIKTPEEQNKMRTAGRLAADVLDMLGDYEAKERLSVGSLDLIR